MVIMSSFRATIEIMDKKNIVMMSKRERSRLEEVWRENEKDAKYFPAAIVEDITRSLYEERSQDELFLKKELFI